MRTRLISIGNSQGIRLPKAVIEQVGLAGELDLEVNGDSLTIRSCRHPREKWAEAAAACHQTCADGLDDWDATTGDFSGTW